MTLLLHLFIVKYLRSLQAASAIEYALMAAAIALGLVVIAFVLGDTVEGTFQVVDDEIAAQGY